jgi:hypothetical protein
MSLPQVGSSPWIFIPGVAEHKGSTRAFTPRGWTRPIITSTNPRHADWEAIIAAHVRQELVALGYEPNTIPFPRPTAVRLGVEFIRPRNASAPKGHTPHLTTKPDLDKLCRTLGDGLSNVLYSDDSQIVGFFYLAKRTAERDEQPGAWLSWDAFGPRDPIPTLTVPVTVVDQPLIPR